MTDLTDLSARTQASLIAQSHIIHQLPNQQSARRRALLKLLLALLSLFALLASLGPIQFPLSRLPVAHAQSTCPSATSGAVQTLGCLQAQGQQGASMMGPGNSTYPSLFYVSYLYEEPDGVGDLVVIDPNSGTVVDTQQLRTTIPSSPEYPQQGTYAMIADGGKVYIGTFPNGHLFQYDPTKPHSTALTDLGQLPLPNPPLSGQQPISYIYGLTQSKYDGNLYACTYPDADLVEINPTLLPSSSAIQNLGSVVSGLNSPGSSNTYAHYCVADPGANSPYIYIGTGFSEADVMVYDVRNNGYDSAKTATPVPGTKTPLPGPSALADVYLGGSVTSNQVYAIEESSGVPDSSNEYLLQNGTATSLTQAPPGQAPPGPVPTNYIPTTPHSQYSGDYINVDGTSDNLPNLCPKAKVNGQPVQQVCIDTAPTSGQIQAFPYSYSGEPLTIFRFGLSKDGSTLYGGTIKPFYMVSCATSGCSPTSSSGVNNLGYVAAGEPYSFLLDNSGTGDFYIANYYTPDLMVYNPAAPVSAAILSHCDDTTYNPWVYMTASSPCGGDPSQNDLRPQAMIYGPAGTTYSNTIYIGGGPDYGSYTGPLIVWTPNPTNPSLNSLTDIGTSQSPFILNESVVSLAAANSGLNCKGFGLTTGCIIGGTSIRGDGEPFPKNSAGAHLFVLDPNHNTIVTHVPSDACTPQTGCPTLCPNGPNGLLCIPLTASQQQAGDIIADVTDLVVNPANNFILYGLADVTDTSGNWQATDLFTYDLESGQVDVPTIQLQGVGETSYAGHAIYSGEAIYNSIQAIGGADKTNYLWGLAANGVFYINTHDLSYGIADAVTCPSSGPKICTTCPGLANQLITSGFATTGGPYPADQQANGTLYFGTISTDSSGIINSSALWQYTIPASFPNTTQLC